MILYKYQVLFVQIMVDFQWFKDFFKTAVFFDFGKKR